ncbi:hypothetical protein [Staphylococcus saprophyticus]|uniref:hypothetical protein n=1 Tax=Staphylococcus saprophyticus TaxID=29385 RepID=UPI0012455E1B|nr:hypothetical protein [Staphylococcus saprophyticus]
MSLEGGLKLKEIWYIEGEGFGGGELKEGRIGLIEEGRGIIAVATEERVKLCIGGKVKEVVGGGGKGCII